jgi:hypothetical protein
MSRRFSAGLVLSALAGVLLFSSCVPMLIYNTQLPEIKAPADKAMCVIIRPMAIMGSNTVPVYFDKKYVGATEGNTMLTFPVEAGEHYIIGDATNKSICRFNFVPGKVYFILHTVVTISPTAYITIVTSTFAPKDGREAMEKIESEKGKIRWVQPNPESPQEDLEDKDFEEIKEDYAEREKKNPEDYKKEADYSGY